MNAILLDCQFVSPEHVRSKFLAVLPRIQTHAQIAFRDIPCADRRAECIAEVVALSWRWFVELAKQGKDAATFVSTLATYVVLAVRNGRGLCGMEKAHDVLSRLAQRSRGFAVTSLPDQSTLAGNPRDDALHDNTQTEVPEQVAFRIDFPEWRRSLAERDRQLVDVLMSGERSDKAASRFGLTPGRVSQKRKAFKEDWSRFVGEAACACKAVSIAS